MTYLSDEFEAALGCEIDRLVQEKQSEFFESPAFYSRLDSEVQKELDSMSPFFSYASGTGRLRLFLSPPEGEAERHIDLEDVVTREINDGDDDHLEIILSGLERLANAIRERISPNSK